MDRWIDEYLARRYEGDWISTGNYHYDRTLGFQVAGKFDAWNNMVSALGDLERPGRDTQHGTARLIMGMRKPKWTYDIDPETGANEFVVGMCWLAAHLSGQGLPTKVCNYGLGVYLMFSEEACTGDTRHIRCEGIVEDVRKLHAKLLKDPQTIEVPEDVHRGSYR